MKSIEAIIDYRGKTPRKTSHGVPLVTAKIVKNGRIGEPSEYIDIADYEAWMRRGIPRQGDVDIRGLPQNLWVPSVVISPEGQGCRLNPAPSGL